MKFFKKFLINRWPKVLAIFLFVILFAAYANIFAVFTPGQTLDPNCAPGITGCIVNSTQSFKTINGNSLIGSGDITVGGGSSQWTTSGNDIYYNNGKVGIGTDSPTASLVTKGSITTTGPELITNGNFDTDSTGWNLYDTGSYNNGKLTVSYAGTENWADLSTDINTEAGKTYLLTFSLSEVEGDTVYFWTDNNTKIYSDSNNYGYSSGTYNLVFTADYTGVDTLHFESWYWEDNSTWSIDNVSMKEVDAPSIYNALDIFDLNNKKILSLGGLDNGNFFVGADSGTSAFHAFNSNFIGSSSGFESDYAQNSNFLGAFSGYQATYASESSFLGNESGYRALYAQESNFLGRQTGFSASYARYSNFLGNFSGYQATNSRNSNFLGYYAGYKANNAPNSNFIGSSAGDNATNASYSNFIGTQAGRGATNASGSTFIGNNAGQDAINAGASLFVGSSAGYGASNAKNATFIGSLAGYYDTVNTTASENDWSILIGYRTNTGGFKNSILLGGAIDGNAISNTKENQFMLAPSVTEMRLNSVDYTLPYSQATASGQVLANDGGGYLSWSSLPVSIIGSSNLFSTGLTGAGGGVTSTSHSNFLGAYAGYQATSASNSNFLGQYAGYQATNATYSNFLNYSAGYNATNAVRSNFLGSYAGSGATNASDSNFLGSYAGSNATSATYSNFIGYSAGSGSANASNSIFIGQNAGANDTVNNTTAAFDFSILIGSFTKTGGFKNSIALGGSATNTASNQFMIGSTTRPINTTVWKGTSATATLDTSTGLITTSDERLKTNIVDLPDDTLSKLVNVRTVTFNWLNGDNDKINIGFLAQDLQNYFPELVYENADKYLGVNYANMTPILTEAIKEMNLKIDAISNFTEDTPLREKILAWFSDTGNGIASLFAKEIHTDKICVKRSDGTEHCVNGDDLDRVFGVGTTEINVTSSNSITPVLTTESVPGEIENIPDVNQVMPAAIVPENTSPENVITVESSAVSPETETPAGAVPADSPTSSQTQSE